MKYKVRMVSAQINRADKLILEKSNKRRLPFSITVTEGASHHHLGLGSLLKNGVRYGWIFPEKAR